MDTDTVPAPRALPSAAERVYAYVRSAILSRRFSDNELLSEGRLAEETAVSRTPVREALLRLEADGLVRLLPKRGALVAPVTAREAKDVLATRELVETYAVRQVLESGRGAELADELTESLSRLQDAAEVGDLVAYVTADRDFHATIVAAAGNQIIDRLYQSLRDRQLRMGAFNLLAAHGSADRRRMAATFADHQLMADAIGAQDLDEALRLTVEHLRHAAVLLS